MGGYDKVNLEKKKTRWEGVNWIHLAQDEYQ
jgi:hypothetical protein